jgi:hypothetical protein
VPISVPLSGSVDVGPVVGEVDAVVIAPSEPESEPPSVDVSASSPSPVVTAACGA